MRRIHGAVVALTCAVRAVLSVGAVGPVETRACAQVIALRPAGGGMEACGWRSRTGRAPAERPLDRYRARSQRIQLTAAGPPPGPHVGFVATATRHVGPGEPPLAGDPDPVTDRAMVLVIGWTMLVLLGGGLLAGRSRGAQGTRPATRRARGAAGPPPVRRYLQPEITPVERFLSK